ncbi:hypothetical protein J4E81_008429 [Alternaria sp. BMP 2799]|nr:hypothetical protein J4E81_008429 [Alternaria sp. BMP 2799]
MPNYKPVPPQTPDHYFDLGLPQSATGADIKKAFRKLALLHHPDKKAPGESEDAAEFRQAREAFDVLKDPLARSTYDILYYQVRSQWLSYRSAYAAYERLEKEARVKAEQERARILQEIRRQEEERKRRAEIQVEEARRQRIRREREALLAEQSRRAVLHALLEQRRRAEERLRKIQEAEARSAKVAEAARLEQEAKAKERLAKQEAETRAQEKEEEERQLEEVARKEHEAKAKELIAQREAYDKARRTRDVSRSHPQHPSNPFYDPTKGKQRRIRIARTWARELHMSYANPLFSASLIADLAGEYVELGWYKEEGSATCDFCDKTFSLYGFVCPLGNAVACKACKMRLSFCTSDLFDGENKGGEGMVEEKWEKVGGRKGKSRGKGRK